MIEVVCGIIYNEDKIFIARRKSGISLAGKWEFPGGKIKSAESEPHALTRELYEELGMNVNLHAKIAEHIHNYSNFTIKLIAYKCEFIDASFELTDHEEFKWVSKEDLRKFDLSEADIPFIDII